MKRKYWIIALLALLLTLAAGSALADVEVNATNFPDENFRQCVVDQYPEAWDLVLSDAELASITRLDCYEKNISNLKGIEYFTSLKQLYCYVNQLTALDLSHNPELEALSCGTNLLTTLDISKNTKLRWLSCYDNQLTVLDVSSNAALRDLICDSNQLTAIDVSGLTQLEELSCDDNKLSALNVTNNLALTYITCKRNQLTTLDISKNTKLKRLMCYGNKLATLDVSNCPTLVSAVGEGRKSGSENDKYGSALFVDPFTAVTAGSTYSAPTVKLITVSVSGKGSAKASAESGKTGDKITLSATPDTGYEFDKWKVISGDVTIENDKFTVGEKHVEIQAVFEGIPHSIDVQYNPLHGTVAVSPKTAIVGTTVTLTIIPANGYQFKEWKVLSGGVTVTNNQFTMGLEDVVILALFEEQAPPAMPSSVTDDTGTYSITSGGTASFTAPAGSAATVSIPATITVNGQPIKVTAIEDNAFKGNKKLTTITIGKYIKTIGKNAFASCTKLKTVKGGAAVVTIKDSAFSGCKVLKTFPAMGKLQTIGANAFKGCAKLPKFTLGAAVKSIGKNAFNGCKALKTITVKTTKLTNKNVGAGAFKGIHSKATFKCPKKQLTAYKKLFVKKGAPKTCKFK